MEQQRFRVSFSLRSKLLLSIVSMLILFTGILSISTIFILQEDKRAYIYESQSTSALLAGHEFSNRISAAVDTLRVALDQNGAQTGRPRALQSLVDHQSQIALISIFTLNGNTFEPIASRGVYHKQGLKEIQWRAPASGGLRALFSEVKDSLKKNGVAFLNLSSPGDPPTLGILATNPEARGKSIPVALGVVSLRSIAEELAGMNLTVANRQGWPLFDTDPITLYSETPITDDPLFRAALDGKTVSGTAEFEHLGKHFLGSYFRSDFNLISLVRTEWSTAMQATYSVMEKLILLGLMAVSGAVIFSILFSRSLTAPINRLYAGTEQVAGGNFDLHLDVTGRDEIAALTASFNTMSGKIHELIKEQMEKVRLEGEIAIASTVQQTLLPAAQFEDRNVLIKSHYESATQCGGDWWNFFQAENRLGLMIADATGHGLPSALITAAARGCFTTIHKLAIETAQFDISPGKLLSHANRVIYEASRGQIMMTFFFALIDFDNKELIYSSAGHHPLWLFKKQAEGFQMKQLGVLGQRLGESPDVPEYEERTISLASGDQIFLFTDGVTEALDQQGEMFGKRRLRRVVEKTMGQEPQAVLDAIVRELRGFHGEAPLDDDVTLTIAQIK